MTETQAEIYLVDRAANQGITVDELLEMTPSSVADNPVESATFWQQRDYSHIKPVSTHPELADDPDNAMPEDPSSNRSRGAEVMTAQEQAEAHLDNEILAMQIDIAYTGDVHVDPVPYDPWGPFVFF